MGKNLALEYDLHLPRIEFSGISRQLRSISERGYCNFFCTFNYNIHSKIQHLIRKTQYKQKRDNEVS